MPSVPFFSVTVGLDSDAVYASHMNYYHMYAKGPFFTVVLFYILMLHVHCCHMYAYRPFFSVTVGLDSDAVYAILT